jgi:hypothetical protein
VAHALAAHPGECHLDAATVTNDAAMLDPLVLAAGAFPILDRAKDAFTEQAAFFGLECAVIDGLGVLNLPLDQERMASGDATEIATYSTRLTLSSPSNSRALSFELIIRFQF